MRLTVVKPGKNTAQTLMNSKTTAIAMASLTTFFMNQRSERRLCAFLTGGQSGLFGMFIPIEIHSMSVWLATVVDARISEFSMAASIPVNGNGPAK